MSFTITILIFFNEYDHKKCLLNSVLIVIVLIVIGILLKGNNDVLFGFLKELDLKRVEQRDWKHIVDDLEEGIIFMDKDHNILYQNDPVNEIFGLI